MNEVTIIFHLNNLSHILKEHKSQFLSNVSKNLFPLKPDILKEHKSQFLSNVSQEIFFSMKPDISH